MKNSKLIYIYKFSLIFFLLLTGFKASAQQTLKLLRTVDCSGSYITVDNLGNIFVIEGSRLLCFDTTGNTQFTYSNISDGPFSSVDVCDPMKLLLFSREFARIRFLDHTLSQKGSDIKLDELGFSNATLACISYQSGFWLYDPSSIQLIRFSSNLQAEQLSGNITMLSGFEINPNFLVENGNLVYLTDTYQGIFIFDRYGAFLKILPYKNICSLQFAGDALIMFTAKEIIVYNTVTLKEGIMTLPDISAISACISQGKLYLLTGKEMKIYKMNI